ncbi:flagellar protein FlaG [Paenibacillus harenae]|uniref:Flagellar protein FlaG n=1 Tax=Paenibacillus harenae TaxID=306543 RepID=A0ABT9UEB2_PAEHA|nr:flagellar protein FlaG [Paenibacillus harenae]MDQ0116559.1 flagellar protein FlaG [Paenibacillus harenae]
MEINVNHNAMTYEKSPVSPIKVVGEYQELKVKSKSSILSVSEQALLSSIDMANKAVQGTVHEFNYKIHEGTGAVIVQIFNKETHELVHELPSEKFIDLVEKLKELTVGAIIDEKR